MENEKADAGRDGRTCLARQNSQARTGTERKKNTLPVPADHEQTWQPYPADLCSATCDDVKYIYRLYFEVYICCISRKFFSSFFSSLFSRGFGKRKKTGVKIKIGL